MPMSKRFVVTALLVSAVAMYGNVPRAQTQAKVQPAASAQVRPAAAKVTTPMAEWGHNIGDDYFLANYQQLTAYWKKLEKESPRLRLQEIGKTVRGPADADGRSSRRRPTTRSSNATGRSPRRLANAEGLTDERRARSRKKARRSSGSTAACTRTKCSARSSCIEHGLPDGQPHRRRDDALPRRRHPAVRARSIPTGWIWSPTGT